MNITDLVSKLSDVLSVYNSDTPINFQEFYHNLNLLPVTPTLIFGLTDVELESHLPPRILLNLQRRDKLFSDNPRYSKNALSSLISVFSEPLSKAKIAKMTLLLHATKINYDERDYTEFINEILITKMIVPMSIPENIEICGITLEHINNFSQQVIENQTIKNIQLEVLRLVDPKLKLIPVNFRFEWLSMPTKHLRGFAGNGTIYLNQNAFSVYSSLTRALSGDEITKLRNSFKIDLAALILHESIHVLLRASAGDLNFSTPIVMTPSNKPAEAGWLAEELLFGKKRDWKEGMFERLFEESFTTYIENFVNALKDNHPLPDYQNEYDVTEIYYRGYGIMAVDQNVTQWYE